MTLPGKNSMGTFSLCTIAHNDDCTISISQPNIPSVFKLYVYTISADFIHDKKEVYGVVVQMYFQSTQVRRWVSKHIEYHE